jgi:hypothetical protein
VVVEADRTQPWQRHRDIRLLVAAGEDIGGLFGADEPKEGGGSEE